MRNVIMKKICKGTALSVSLVATFCTSDFLSPPVTANSPRITSNVDVKPESALTAQEEQGLSLAAGKLLNHVDHARIDLKSKNMIGAKREVDKALTLGHIIKTAVPSYLVTTKLAAGQFKYEDQSKVQPLFVTLHDELNVETVMGPVREAKREAAKKLAADSGQIVQDVKLHESRARLDVGLALAGLEQAKRYLAENKLSLADGSLSTIQTGIVMEYVVADLPLERVQTNLMLARQAIKNNNLDQARLVLKVAQDALQEYEKTAGANRAKESSDLRSEIQSLSASIQQTNPNALQEKITNWWNTVTHWFK